MLGFRPAWLSFGSLGIHCCVTIDHIIERLMARFHVFVVTQLQDAILVG